MTNAINACAPKAPARSVQRLESVDVCIIGGGLGGLALAAGLRLRGIDAHVFEAAPKLRNETSTLISLGPNAWVALEELHPGLPADLKRRGVEDCTTITRLRPPPESGIEPTTLERPGSASRLTTIRWAETQDALALLVPDEVVHCDHPATGYTEEWEQQAPAVSPAAYAAAAEGTEAASGGAAAAEGGGAAEDGAATEARSSGKGPASSVVVHFRGQPSVRARLVVGADGIFSAVRAAMYPHEPPARYLGHMNWNCLLHNPGGNTVVDAHKPGQVIYTSDGGMGPDKRLEASLIAYMCDAGGGYTFWQVRMQYDQPCFTVDLLRHQQRQQQQQQRQQDGGADDGANGSSSNGDNAANEDNSRVDEGSANVILGGSGAARRGRGGMGVPGSKQRCLDRLKAAGWEWMVPLVAATPESSIFERALYDRLPLDDWAAPGRRVVLLGDSAHGMHPGPGQGARTAFEDAHQLTLALAALWPDVPAAVERYMEARVVRANRIQAFASEHCGLESVRRAAAPPGLTPAELWERSFEFRTWFDQYPRNPHGDPETKWWKPITGKQQAGAAEATAGAGAGAAAQEAAGRVEGGVMDGKTAADGRVVLEVRVVARDGACCGEGGKAGASAEAAGHGEAKGQEAADSGGGVDGVRVKLAVLKAA
ncbi:hypothetical protein HYH02_004741 [Chlamydomonas schloesseri]|uniref:FAD-binding domain-containing protein n=1 Tax=Chlamydomonas schloesseri TaxID=2026947 RepID=A0A836B946_9CHLO|nr:hypothetical protein HYH02_004741 [Chlamydomonas schloesseri]|eukprot:KAG2450909.1 hypothetical protein HYH02_004741 [Chlamydomonas schloesseri]